MVNDGILERKEVKVKGVANKVVAYRLKRQVIAGLNMKRAVLTDNI
jgi:hypothetical protein